MIEEVIAQILNDSNIGIYAPDNTNGNIFLYDMPNESPSSFWISVVKTGGKSPMLNHFQEYPLITIYVRGLDRMSTENKIENIDNIIREKTFQNDKIIINQIAKMGETNYIREDNNKESYLYDINYLISYANL